MGTYAAPALRALADRDMRRHGLHLGQNHLLALLWEADGRTPGAIAAELQVTTPTVTKKATRVAAALAKIHRTAGELLDSGDDTVEGAVRGQADRAS